MLPSSIGEQAGGEVRSFEHGGLMSVEQAAQALGLRPSTIREWVALRKIAHVKIGRLLKIQRSEIARVINDNLVPARPLR